MSIEMSARQRIYFIYSHGLFHNYTQAFTYMKKYCHPEEAVAHEKSIIHSLCTLFDYADATHAFFRIKPRSSALGQKAEVEQLKKVYDTVCAQAEKEGDDFLIILFGVSRGAAVIVNFVGTHQPSHVGALVLESPYDSIATVIDHIRYTFGYAVSHDMIQKIFELFFGTYTRTGIAPIDVVDRIDSAIPVLIVCSQEDARVPATSSFALYKKLRTHGHKKSHLLVLNHGSHGHLYTGPDSYSYISGVNKFYKQYNAL